MRGRGSSLQRHLSDGGNLEQAAALAKLADVAICVVGYDYLDEGEFVGPEMSGPWTDHFPKPTGNAGVPVWVRPELHGVRAREPPARGTRSLRTGRSLRQSMSPTQATLSGEEVIQLSVGARSSAVERAPKELKAFSKVALAPGETRTVHLAVPAADLAYYDPANGWTVEPGNYEVIVGRHALDDQALRTQFAVR